MVYRVVFEVGLETEARDQNNAEDILKDKLKNLVVPKFVEALKNSGFKCDSEKQFRESIMHVEVKESAPYPEPLPSEKRALGFDKVEP
jgi:hypothetical protein